jgi:hypothetical protein
MVLDQCGHPLPLILIEPRTSATSVREGIWRAGLALTAQEITNRGGTDAKQFGHFVLSVIATFIGFYDSVAEIIRVGFHS